MPETYLILLSALSEMFPVHSNLSLQLPAAAGPYVSSPSSRDLLVLALSPTLEASSAIYEFALSQTAIRAERYILQVEALRTHVVR